MSIINSQPRIGAAGQSTGGYRIERSLRFNSADSAYLSRTPSSSSNRKTWTWSAWVKLSKVDGTWQSLFSAYTTSDAVGDRFEFNYENLGSGPVLYAQLNQSSVTFFVTNAVYRDPSAWYHIVLAVDTTQASASNQFKLYINNVQQTFSSNNGVTQNTDLAINRNIAHAIGRREKSTTEHFSGYMTEINFIDGQALTPSSFGETDTDTGVWKPKAYSGSYGTNGFYLKFADNSGTTSTTLGKDSSGNGNNWTPNNFYVGPGTTNAEKAGIDSLVDTPTPYGTDTGAGGEVRGNYCTLNPLNQTGASLTNGNLQFTKSGGAGASLYTIHPTLLVSSGKWYFEVTPTAINTNGSLVGIVGSDVALATYSSLSSMTGNIWAYRADAYKVNNGSSASYGNTWTTNDVIGVAVDMDNGKIWWSKNGTWQASGDPAAGTNAAYTNVSGSIGPLLIDQGISGTFDGSINAGQRPFAYTAPSGFKALCTQNLPTPTIGATATTRAGKYFNPVLYTGTGITNSVTGVGFQPDFTWIKQRNSTEPHVLSDVVRGSTKALYSNTTGAEETEGPNSFDSDGFTLGSGWYVNRNTYTYVAWNWKANGAGSTGHTQGSITSTASVSTLSGFSIVTYTGNGTSGATVGHGLGVTPSMVMIHRRDAVSNWQVKHVSLNANQNLELNSTAAVDTAPGSGYISAISSTTLTLLNGGSAITNVNANTGTYLVYCFAPVAGYSAFGSYTGNGSTDGPMVFTGFRPKYVLLKRSDATASWYVHDTVRDTYNQTTNSLYPNLSSAEDQGYLNLDILSNGFKIRTTTSNNASGGTYVYAAFAESPFKYSLAR